MCWSRSATAAWPTTSSRIGHNFEAVLSDLETRMREAAADLNFEEAARLRDEVKRLRATELAVVDDPTAKQRTVQGKAGAYAGTKKYGEAANLPVSAMKKKGVSRPSRPAAAPLLPRPVLHGVETSEARSWRVGVRGNPRAVPAVSKVHKPHLDEMHGPESLPFRPDGAKPRKPDLGTRQQNLPAHQLAPIRPRVRPRAAIERRRAGASGWVEEEVADQRSLPGSRRSQQTEVLALNHAS